MTDYDAYARVIAQILRGEEPAAKTLEALPEKWGEMARTLLTLKKGERVSRFEAETVGNGMREAVDAAIRELSKPPHRKTNIGATLNPTVAELITTFPLKSPDEDVRRAILSTLEGPQERGKRPSVRMRKLAAGKRLLDWLQEQGAFVQSEACELFYFWRAKRQLFALDSDRFAAWLYALSGCNPAGRDFAFLLSDCKAAAIEAETRPVVRLAAWDGEAEVLRVSRFDGTVFVLDGEQIREEGNGEGGILFDDRPIWAPYEPEYEAPTGQALNWWSVETPHWDTGEAWNVSNRRHVMYGLGLRAWLLSAFCTELCPARPMLVLKGDMGSGKSSLMRTMLRLVFGPGAQVGGVPDKPDGFTAWAASEHFLVIDNLDQFVGWLRDKLARISTGATDTYRKLYSNNEAGQVIYRCWVAIPSRTPDTLKRDDLADRMIMLPLARIPNERRERETHITATEQMMRNQFWGDLLTALNQVVAGVRAGELEGMSRLRMADWESLGRLIAQQEGNEELWERFIDEMTGQQAEFLVEDNIVFDGIVRWMAEPTNAGRKMMVRDLYAEVQAALFGDDRPHRDWPRTVRSFGRQLGAIVRALQRQMDVHREKGTKAVNRGSWVYQFWPLGKMPRQETLI